MSDPRDSHYYLLEADAQLQAGSFDSATANALTGVLATIAETLVKNDADYELRRLHAEADDALGRVLNLAGQLEAGDYAGKTAAEVAADLRTAVETPARLTLEDAVRGAFDVAPGGVATIGGLVDSLRSAGFDR